MELVAIIIALIVPIGVAKIACENVGHNVSDHFPDVRKTIVHKCTRGTVPFVTLVAEGNALNQKIEEIIKKLGE